MNTRNLIWLAALALGVLVSTACVSSAQTDGAEVAQSDGDSDEDSDGIVCRTERPTGSNIAQRVCYDPAEAERRREEDQQTLRDSGRYGCEGAGCSGGGD